MNLGSSPCLSVRHHKGPRGDTWVTPSSHGTSPYSTFTRNDQLTLHGPVPLRQDPSSRRGRLHSPLYPFNPPLPCAWSRVIHVFRGSYLTHSDTLFPSFLELGYLGSGYDERFRAYRGPL